MGSTKGPFGLVLIGSPHKLHSRHLHAGYVLWDGALAAAEAAGCCPAASPSTYICSNEGDAHELPASIWCLIARFWSISSAASFLSAAMLPRLRLISASASSHRRSA